MSGIWDELTGQKEAIAAVRAAAAGDGLAHSWLITGPPGSGRSTLAYAFATELLARADQPGDLEHTAAQVAARTHPDLAVLSTEAVIIKIDDVRQLVSASQFSPAVGRYRVMVIEDADRMTERTSNVLLKALEEPPPRTVWILCAPSEADLLPTIRSRVRTVRLRVPEVGEVADLLSLEVDHGEDLAGLDLDGARLAGGNLNVRQQPSLTHRATSSAAPSRHRSAAAIASSWWRCRSWPGSCR